ncbi:MAG TPA: ABC transporter ATP-binding protein [Candidatus Enterenecus faecium]|uniref:ABC transporter ATP-binding protein n=1 Tax=Candidatus Enterenecus faecium TaxID=2840780 RepID=A0A9D0YQC5_9FIRM|nr:ABC transporter ATP-binding protein [Candidatus Enterenecus faecium]
MNKTNCTSIWRLAGPGALVCYALLAPLSALCSSLFALSLQPVVDTGLSGDLARFGLACLAAFLLGAVDLGLNHWTVSRQAALVHRCTNRLCQHYLHQILAQKVERLQGQDSAVYLSKLTADAPLISSGYLGNALDLYRSAWSLIASLAVLAAAGWELAALAVLCALVSLVLPKLLQRSADQAEAAYLDANRTHLAQAQEILTNFLLIRLYGLAPEQEARYGNAATQVERADNRRQVVRQRMNTLGSAISQLSFVLLLAGAMLLVIQGKLSVGYTMSLTQLLGGVMFPFEVLPGYWIALQTGKRLYRSNLEQLQNGLDSPGIQPLSHAPRQLALHGVSFAYPHRPLLVEHLTLHLDCTKKYALVGGSGSGKSTLAKLLLGFLTPTRGSVTLDGIPLEQVESVSLYRAIGYQSQNNTFFRDTLEHNILLGRSLSPEDWRQLLQQVQLAHWVAQLPHQAQTVVEENGKNLSGGQAQRVALARCLAGHPTFLVLDEITSALDPKTAGALMDTVLALEGVGLLAITHDLSEERLKRFDSILVLRDGALTEQGSWEALMAQQGELYRLSVRP